MRLLELTENAPPNHVNLSVDEAEVLSMLELAEVNRRPGSSTWEVRAGRKVGIARIGSLQVIVRPKIRVDRLLFMMRYARSPRFWRDGTVHADIERDFIDVLAGSFTRQARIALEQGLLHGYIPVEESLPVFKGRLRVGDQITRHHRVSVPLEVAYEHFSVDIPENHLLLGATLRLLRQDRVDLQTRRELHRLRVQLADVTPPDLALGIPLWQPTRLNVRYHPALALAEAILAGNSFEQRFGDLRVGGFVFDMWRVYEGFVCVALSEALRAARGRAEFQHRMHLDSGRRVDMNPDLLWTGVDGRRIVVDAKYKEERPSGFPNADLYQVLAYCTVLGLTDGHLVYAQGNEQAREYTVMESGVRIHAHTVDLDLPPEQVLQRIGSLADEMLRTAVWLKR